jgi:hypothetical protein
VSIPNDSPTLLDITRRLDPNGSIAAVAEILSETNEMLMDIPFMEGNLTTGHRSTVRTGLPAPTWREFYGRVQPTKSRTAQVVDSTAMMEAYAEVDAALADLNGNAPAFRLSEDYAHIEGMSQAAQQAFLWGNSNINPNQFNGLAPRFSSIAGAENGENIVDAGGTGSDNGSIWIVAWGAGRVYGIYPKGSSAGLKIEDKSPNGPITSEGGVGTDGEQKGFMEVYRTHYRWDLGMVVEDWRFVVRIANIDRSDLNATATAPSANLPQLIFEALERLPNLNGRLAIYMDRRMRSMLRMQLANKVSNSTLTYQNVGGIRVAEIDGIPIRRVDKLSVNEARVV